MIPTHDELDIALNNNNLDDIVEIESDLRHCLNSTRARANLAFTPHAKEIADRDEKYILVELQRCRSYRQQVDLVLNNERNTLQVWLAINEGMQM